MMEVETDILRGQFELLPTKRKNSVILSKTSLTYGGGRDGCCVCLGQHGSLSIVTTKVVDIYGAKAYQGPEGDTAAYFQVYSCPRYEKKRVRRKVCFRVSSSESEEGNIAIAEQWVRTILWLIKDPERNLSSEQGKTTQEICHIKGGKIFLCKLSVFGRTYFRLIYFASRNTKSRVV